MIPAPAGTAARSLAACLAAHLPGLPAAGDRHRLDNVEFVVREVEAGRITRIGLRIPTHLH